jgi:glycosyltransferase involved in cell wall biosynthesis
MTSGSSTASDPALGFTNVVTKDCPRDPGPSLGRVGLVAIGRNEGERLRRCLEGARTQVQRLVYVDSGSSDGSAEMAKALGAEVVELDTTTHFTAARARNAGYRRLRELEPSLDFVQFVDGDCELVQGWIGRAMAFARSHPTVAVVCGRRRERSPEASVYNRLCDREWNTPVGKTDACGGDALMRVEALDCVSGYDPTLIAGEEPELCARLRLSGWEIWRIEGEMTLHDAAMHKARQWWQRMRRSGHAYAEVSHRHGGEPLRMWVRETRSIWVWGSPIAWPAWPLLWWRVYRRSGDAPFATAITLGKFPQFLGQIEFWCNRALGKRRGLIEHR